jgi:hypothetical protein
VLPTRPDRGTLVDAALVALAGAVVYWLAVDLFPYLSVNDDEGVYLTQAAMLLEGRLFLYPGDLTGLVRPWFFVADEFAGGVRYYPKYTPVAAAVFAVGRLLGDAEIALGLVAAGVAAGVRLLGDDAFDRTTGRVAAAALLLSPMFLLTSAAFLAYAPTALFQVAFVVAYVRTVRRESPRWGAAAGVAIGLAFFSRPYTAVLFASPFVLHALYSLAATRDRRVLARYLAIAAPGLLFVGVHLGYNAVVTGDPTVFPYEAFGPRDGIGFGERELLDYERTYTPALAAASSTEALSMLFGRWGPAGVVGSALAAVGLGATLRGGVPRPDGRSLPDREVALLLAAVGPAVVLREAYFWGTLNGLSNGLIDLLGPFYHFDVLVPFAVFAAHGAVVVSRRTDAALRGRPRTDGLRVVAAALALLVVAATVGGALAGPYAENRQRTENLAATYEPFERTDLEDAVVFTPDPYGDWVHHPFQYLRNDPGFDGDAVYVLDEGPAADFRALDATGDRRPYRFTYRGEWTGATRPVDPALVPLSVESGRTVQATTTVGAPVRTTRASVRIETTEGYARYEATDVGERVPVEWRVGVDGAAVTGLERLAGPERVPLPAGASEVDLVVTFVGSGGASVTYRQEVTVEATGDRVRVVWPPETRVCRLTTECGSGGTWVGPDGDYLPGVSVTTTAAGT